MAIAPEHIANAAKAQSLYLDSLKPAEARADWRFLVRRARKTAAAALRASDYLFDIERALAKDGRHALVFRQVLSPPVSQDQFKLICPEYSKGLEKTGKPSRKPAAVAAVISERLDSGVAGWVKRGVRPNHREMKTFLRVASTLIGSQQMLTDRRTDLAFKQESALMDLLVAEGWTRLPAKLISTFPAMPERNFMHKVKFATATTASQEVDIACGLKDSYVLAMECKVTNDRTNSVKRINDILKKAEAWKKHWGSFAITAALLQGVIAPTDVQRLTDADVLVFWSHDLDAFRAWLVAKTA